MSTLANVILEGLDASKPAASIPGRLYFATDTGKIYYDTGSAWSNVTPGGSGGFTNASLGITVDGGGSVPATGSKGYLSAPYAGTITGWTLLANASGSAQITVKKSSGFAGFPTTTSIVASAPPALSSAQGANSTTLTGWTTAFSLGDVFEFNLDSIATISRVTLALKVTRSS